MKGNKIMDETMIFDGHSVSVPRETKPESAHTAENDTATKVIPMKAIRLKKKIRNSEAVPAMEAEATINKENAEPLKNETVHTAQPETEPQVASAHEPVQKKVAAVRPLRKASPKQQKRKLRLSCPAKTIFISFVFAMWTFMNFFVLAHELTFQFYFSFFTMAATYALLCLDHWFVRLRYIGVSLAIQQITLIAAWVFYINHVSEPVSHWMALMYAGYHLMLPGCMILTAFAFRAVGRFVQRIVDKFNARVEKVKAIQARRAERAAMLAAPQPAGMEVLTTPEAAGDALQNLSSAEKQTEQTESGITVA